MQNTLEQAEWLENPASLSKRLRAYTQQQIEFVLQEASWARASSDELIELENAGQRFWCREISWQYYGKCWVWARTLISETALEILPNELMHNPNLAIGEILFSGNVWQRGEIKKFLVDANHFYAAKLVGFSAEIIWPLSARRSLFLHNDKKILVSEVFFPEFLCRHPHESDSDKLNFA